MKLRDVVFSDEAKVNDLSLPVEGDEASVWCHDGITNPRAAWLKDCPGLVQATGRQVIDAHPVASLDPRELSVMDVSADEQGRGLMTSGEQRQHSCTFVRGIGPSLEAMIIPAELDRAGDNSGVCGARELCLEPAPLWLSEQAHV